MAILNNMLKLHSCNLCLSYQWSIVQWLANGGNFRQQSGNYVCLHSTKNCSLTVTLMSCGVFIRNRQGNSNTVAKTKILWKISCAGKMSINRCPRLHLMMKTLVALFANVTRKYYYPFCSCYDRLNYWFVYVILFFLNLSVAWRQKLHGFWYDIGALLVI